MRTGAQKREGGQNIKAILVESLKKHMGKQSNAWLVY